MTQRRYLEDLAVGEVNTTPEIAVSEADNFLADFNTPTKIFQIPSKGIRESSSTTAQDGPTAGVTGS